MKNISLFFLLMVCAYEVFSQVKIHSHNDYTRTQPFFDAYAVKADEIEADIFLVDGKLIVAHSKKEIDTANTLTKLYLDPISGLFTVNQNKVSADAKYTFALMIDVKDDWASTWLVLQKTIESYGDIFNRSVNKQAIQVIISGNRPASGTFHTYPAWLFFDGLPNLVYAKKDLKKIPLISDNFANSSKWNGKDTMIFAEKHKLLKIIESAHRLKKGIRFWGAPDDVACWQLLSSLGVDYINTDKIGEFRHFIDNNGDK